MKLIVELVDWVNHFMMVGYSWRYFSSINQFNSFYLMKQFHHSFREWSEEWTEWKRRNELSGMHSFYHLLHSLRSFPSIQLMGNGKSIELRREESGRSGERSKFIEVNGVKRVNENKLWAAAAIPAFHFILSLSFNHSIHAESKSNNHSIKFIPALAEFIWWN